MRLNGFTFYFVRITARPENLRAYEPAYFGDPTCYPQYGMKRESAQCADLAFVFERGRSFEPKAGVLRFVTPMSTEREKLVRDINGLKETVRQTAVKPMTPTEGVAKKQSNSLRVARLTNCQSILPETTPIGQRLPGSHHLRRQRHSLCRLGPWNKRGHRRSVLLRARNCSPAQSVDRHTPSPSEADPPPRCAAFVYFSVSRPFTGRSARGFIA
jgi:hypothetical protein